MVSDDLKITPLILTIGTLAICWFVHRTFYHRDYGKRPWLAFGCTTVAFIGCVMVGLYVIVLSAIGGAAG